MTEPRDQSPRGFEQGGGPEGAHRFWEQYASARSQRPARNGESSRPGPAEEQARPAGEHECLDWCPICRGADVVRATAPPEIREQLAAFQRDSLMMLRTLIDAYLSRVDGPAQTRRDDRVQDIRID
ncbi:MAG TPA: hypothetical protein VKA89_12080 [Solirubrobacterales bacterium]|nr:hypothetical protein [Solirubrobacterales bacterium]